MTELKETGPEEAALQKIREELNSIRTDIVKLRDDQKNLRLSKKTIKTKLKTEHMQGKEDLLKTLHVQMLQKLTSKLSMTRNLPSQLLLLHLLKAC